MNKTYQSQSMFSISCFVLLVSFVLEERLDMKIWGVLILFVIGFAWNVVSRIEVMMVHKALIICWSLMHGPDLVFFSFFFTYLSFLLQAFYLVLFWSILLSFSFILIFLSSLLSLVLWCLDPPFASLILPRIKRVSFIHI